MWFQLSLVFFEFKAKFKLWPFTSLNLWLVEVIIIWGFLPILVNIDAFT